MSDALSSAIRHLESLGAVVEEVSLPSFAVGLPAYYVIALSEASSNLSRYDGVRYGHRAEAEGAPAAHGAETADNFQLGVVGAKAAASRWRLPVRHAPA